MMKTDSHSFEEKPNTSENSDVDGHNEGSRGSSVTETAKPNVAVALLLALMLACGGFIFGYDTGTISGFLNMNSFIQRFGEKAADGSHYFPVYRSGLIVSLLSIGALVGGIASSKLADTYGRIKTLAGFNAIYVVAIVIQITSRTSWVQVMMGRFVSGISIGAFTVVVPMLISESVPSDARGPCVSTFQLMITIGIFIGNVICYGFRNDMTDKSWHVPLGISLVFSFILFMGLLVLPESPRYLAAIGKVEQGCAALGKTVRMPPTSGYIVNEMEEIVKSVEEDRAAGTASWSELYTGKPKIFYRVVIGIMMLSIQQLCGANYFFYYGTSLFKSIGSDDSYANSMILSGVNFACTVAGVFVVSKFNRRTLLTAGSVVMLVAFAVFASLGSFALNPHGPSEPSNSTVGKVMIFFACLFICGFAVTWAPLAYVVVSEIFPQRIRSKAMSLATGAMWLWNFVISFCTPMITNHIGYKYGYVFTAFILASFFMVHFFVHETKGVTLEHINDMYANNISAIASTKYIRRFTHKEEFDHDEEAATA